MRMQVKRLHIWMLEDHGKNSSQILRLNYFEPRILHPAKLSIKYKSKRKNIWGHSKTQAT